MPVITTGITNLISREMEEEIIMAKGEGAQESSRAKEAGARQQLPPIITIRALLSLTATINIVGAEV